MAPGAGGFYALLATWSTALIEAYRALGLKLPDSTC
jgi:hypothetical protein